MDHFSGSKEDAARFVTDFILSSKHDSVWTILTFPELYGDSSARTATDTSSGGTTEIKLSGTNGPLLISGKAPAGSFPSLRNVEEKGSNGKDIIP